MIRNENKEVKRIHPRKQQQHLKQMHGSSNAQGPSNIHLSRPMRNNGNMAVKRLRGYDASLGKYFKFFLALITYFVTNL